MKQDIDPELTRRQIEERLDKAGLIYEDHYSTEELREALNRWQEENPEVEE